MDEITDYVTSHGDDDNHDDGELTNLLRLAYRRNPDDDDRSEGLWSHIASAAFQMEN